MDMPPNKRAAAAKRPRLTLAQLAAYDDMLTDALVDHVSLAAGGFGTGEARRGEAARPGQKEAGEAARELTRRP